MLRRIYDNFERLSAFPSLKRTGRIDGTRELAIADTPYVIIYVLSDRCILSSASSTERSTGPTPEHGKMKID